MLLIIIIINPFFTFCSNNALGTNLASVRYKAFVPSLDNAYGIVMRVWLLATFQPADRSWTKVQPPPLTTPLDLACTDSIVTGVPCDQLQNTYGSHMSLAVNLHILSLFLLFINRTYAGHKTATEQNILTLLQPLAYIQLKHPAARIKIYTHNTQDLH